VNQRDFIQEAYLKRMKGKPDPVYFVDQRQLYHLEQVTQKLFGDGTTLSPDNRRDLANLMRLVVDEIKNQVQP